MDFSCFHRNPLCENAKRNVKRPENKNGIKSIIKPPDKYCFPSGHCSSSILLTLLVAQYAPSMIIYFTIWTVLVFISRIALGMHYLSDSIGGIILGSLSFYVANQIFKFI